MGVCTENSNPDVVVMVSADAAAALSVKLTDDEIMMLETPYVPHHLTKF